MANDTSADSELMLSEFTEIRETGKAMSLVYDSYHYLVGWGEAPARDTRTGRDTTRAMCFESLFDLDTDP